MSGSKPVSWLGIPEIKKDVDMFAKMRSSDDPKQVEISSTLFSALGDTLQLEVRVNDPALAQVVLSSLYRPGGSLIPGFDIEKIITQPDAHSRQSQAMLLRNLADRLESNETI